MNNLTKGVVGLVVVGVLGWLAFGYFGVQALFKDTVVNESVPQIAASETPPETTDSRLMPRLIAQGIFEQGDSTYTIQGKVTVTEKDGVRTVAFTEFDVTNGPDLFVYLVTSPKTENDSVKQAVAEKRFVNLGALKGNKGNQVYTLPPEVEFSDESIISIWCRRFSRNFGAADLILVK